MIIRENVELKYVCGLLCTLDGILNGTIPMPYRRKETPEGLKKQILKYAYIMNLKECDSESETFFEDLSMVLPAPEEDMKEFYFLDGIRWCYLADEDVEIRSKDYLKHFVDKETYYSANVDKIKEEKIKKDKLIDELLEDGASDIEIVREVGCSYQKVKQHRDLLKTKMN